MSDAANDWVAPYVQNEPHLRRIGQVWVVNPGPNPTQVTVRYYGIDRANVTEEHEQTIPPFSCRPFHAGPEPRGAPAEDGWCRISSEYPVLPWGFTAFRTNPSAGDEQWGFANMSFYPGDPEFLGPIPTTAPRKH